MRDLVPRRAVLRGQTLSLGALTLLTGCDVSNGDAVQSALRWVSRLNDRVQEALFDPTRLAPTFSAERAVADFRYNAFYAAKDAPRLDAGTFKLELAGLIGDKRAWTVEQLHGLPQVTQITRHVCVEGWSMIGQWGGAPLGDFLRRVGADTTAKYVGFACADGYYSSIDMASALHPQTLMAFSLAGKTLPAEHGFPFKIRIPTKLGFKNPKFVTAMFVTNRYPGGFWEDRGYNWFSGS